jgi:3-hydroxyanthranilate 3,4-dioxygenase
VFDESLLSPILLQKWMHDHAAFLRPPLAHKLMYSGDDLIILGVSGPNTKPYFHVNPSEELILQISGDMTMRMHINGGFFDQVVREGELFVVPKFMPHRPIREQGTIALVIERRRQAEEMEGYSWYCDGCGHLARRCFYRAHEIDTMLPLMRKTLGALSCERCGIEISI